MRACVCVWRFVSSRGHLAAAAPEPRTEGQTNGTERLLKKAACGVAAESEPAQQVQQQPVHAPTAEVAGLSSRPVCPPRRRSHAQRSPGTAVPPSVPPDALRAFLVVREEAVAKENRQRASKGRPGKG